MRAMFGRGPAKGPASPAIVVRVLCNLIWMIHRGCGSRRQTRVHMTGNQNQLQHIATYCALINLSIYIYIYVCCTYVCMYPVCYTELFSEISYVCIYISAVRRLRTLRLVPSCGAKRQRHGACCHEVQFLCEGSRNLRGKAHVCSQGA